MEFHIFLILCMFILFIITNIKKRENYRKNIWFLRIAFFILFIFVGFREFSVGSDTLGYVGNFITATKLRWNVNFFGYFEPGFMLFNVLLSYLFSSPRMFLLVTSAIFNYGVYKLIKENSNNYFLSTIMYICLLFLYSSMSMIRQFLAVIIVIYSIKYCKNKKIVKFLLVIYIATLFHSSAWIGLLLYPAYNMKYSKKVLLIIFMGTVFGFLFAEPIVSKIMSSLERNNYYIERVNSFKIANILYSIVYLIFFLFVLYKKKKYKDLPNYYVYISALAFSINFIAIKLDILARAAMYFEIFTIFIIPNCMLMEKKVLNYQLESLIIFIFLILYSSTIIILRPEWNSAYRYKLGENQVNNKYICSQNTNKEDTYS